MRPTAWSEELEEKAREYVSSYESYGHPFPSVVGLCQVLNRARSTIYAWKDDESKGFSDILEQINEAQQLVAWDRGLRGKYNASLVKLLLGKHGYSDKAEMEHSGPNGGPIQVNDWSLNPVSSVGKDSD